MTQEEFIYFRNERELYLGVIIEKPVTGEKTLREESFFLRKNVYLGINILPNLLMPLKMSTLMIRIKFAKKPSPAVSSFFQRTSISHPIP
jgi:hypothetical protein